MSNANNTWLGSNNSSSPANLTAERALQLKVYAGEVVTAFEKHTIMLDKHNVRTIKNGKSAQFPVIGRMPDAEYHTPGAEILGQDILHGERDISIDRLLISHIFIDNLDEVMTHFDVLINGLHGKTQSLRPQRTLMISSCRKSAFWFLSLFITTSSSVTYSPTVSPQLTGTTMVKVLMLTAKLCVLLVSI
jgi:hypothetical protein